MRHRTLERAAAAGVALSLLTAAAAFADTVVRDADSLVVGDQSTRDIGRVAPGAVVDAQVMFVLDCGGTQHVDRGQSLVVELWSATVPEGGGVAMAPVALGPVPAAWPLDGQECSGTETSIAGVGTVTVTAPAAPGTHAYPLLFEMIPTPAGSGDGSAASGSTAITLSLDVVAAVEPANTPPSLVLPGDMTVVADVPGGWTATYVVTTTDAEDEPDPVAACAPAVGAVLPAGTTTVTCSVTDLGGLTATGSFAVTVEAPLAEPEPEPIVAATIAVFGPPVKADGLDGRAGRTIPMKVRLMAGDAEVDEGSLALVVTSCAGGDPVAELDMEWRAGSERWFGLLRTRDLEAGCYAVRALHDGADVGGFELRLFDKRADAAKEKAGAAKEKAGAAGRKAATGVAKGTGGAAERGGNGKGRP